MLDLSCICLYGLEFRRCIHIGGFLHELDSHATHLVCSKPDFRDFTELDDLGRSTSVLQQGQSWIRALPSLLFYFDCGGRFAICPTAEALGHRSVVYLL